MAAANVMGRGAVVCDPLVAEPKFCAALMGADDKDGADAFAGAPTRGGPERPQWQIEGMRRLEIRKPMQRNSATRRLTADGR